MNFEAIKTIIMAVLPNVNDMKLVQEYGLVNWVVVFLVKFLTSFAILVLILLIAWLIYKILQALSVKVSWKKDTKSGKKRK